MCGCGFRAHVGALGFAESYVARLKAALAAYTQLL